ncbi:MAG: bifunctional riboflavin kinase/FMN adenylyltransferase [Phycisphaeraceae bacterium]
MTRRCVITIGNFDGVHLGHRAILAVARRRADVAGVEVVAMTFDPPPAAVLRPGSQPLAVMSLPRRIATLRQCGVDNVRVVAPTQEFLQQGAADFVHQMVQEHHPIAVVEGPDFRFGRGRAGDNDLLTQMAPQLGFETYVVPRIEVVLHDLLIAPVKSSLVRWLIGAGRVADAARCLAQAPALEGGVVKGEQRGRTIGVPTVNLDDAALIGRAVPGDGVYAGWVELADGPRHAAAISVGVKPTFGHPRRVVEAHLLDFRGDLYGQRISVQFARYLRDQQPFPGVKELVAQLGRDIAAVRRLRDADLLSPPALASRYAMQVGS